LRECRQLGERAGVTGQQREDRITKVRHPPATPAAGELNEKEEWVGEGLGEGGRENA
jgi:hypothetical protein